MTSILRSGLGLQLNLIAGNRFLHVGSRIAAVNKGNLAKLRKTTGFTIANCKKALEKHDNDLEKAEEWLNAEAQAQGWAKATKLSGRSTAQGLVGVHIDGSVASLVEVNCETDFVAKNEEFKSLVAQTAKECTANTTLSLGNSLQKEYLSGEQLGSQVTSDGKTLSDHLALLIGKVGENMSLSRAARIIVPQDTQLIGYSHPSQPNTAEILGKFGAVVALRSPNTLTEVARELCVHIVGMNPKAIGSEDDPKANNPDDETLLVHQEFLADSSMTVGEVLKEKNIEILDYIRFECGEQNENN